jgi:tetratricopeptide (TPR) repeat protein
MRVAGPDALAELEDERRFLLRSLDDLDREHAAGDIDDVDYDTLRDGYTARAAAVLRAIDDHRAALPPHRRKDVRRTVAWTALAVVVAVLAGVAVAWASGQRLPGDTGSGNPTDTVTAALAQARALQAVNQFQAAIGRYEEVLAVEPDNAEALAYRGWLVALVGNQARAADLVTKGQASIERAMVVAPAYADPFCFDAVVRFRLRNDAKGAKAPIERCLALHPPQAVTGLVEGLKGAIDGALARGA